ncbi:serine hydrolase domain-containing protein [Streptomyces candidus]|uniref:CubicO group peptidase (Beta-lactamase class C family) n=1 Tax=Streptomyces candidus TaxID=67283 RepID=A0A7X0HH43_9ACTN|nr:serine hydrolase domain-containing protein [Streptomyces candidus]MBB6437537.1 CubicO group peptidase (beta-lactamase class C family) [Streptomyces candidus]GHH53921.1 esterase [Streptomyces candidus]
MTDASVCTDLTKQLQRAADELVESGAERGMQVAVHRHGELVADIVAGIADPATGREVRPDTPFYNFSLGKGVTATLAHVCAERGYFGERGYDTPVADLWPEFAAHGKQAVTVRHALTHSAGVPGIPAATTHAELCDWDAMCAALADVQPWWEPGAAVGYHAYTFGYLVGEIVRRTTGRSLTDVLREELTDPLGITDELYFGMPEAQQHRLARLEEDPARAAAFDLSQLPDDLPMFRAAPKHLFPSAAFGNRADILAADIPAGAKTSARAVARMYAAVLGEVDGVRLLSPERTREATALAMSGPDQLMGNESAWALGYAVGLPHGSAATEPTVFGMAGVGGSWAGADTATGTAWAITKNVLGANDPTVARISHIVRNHPATTTS